MSERFLVATLFVLSASLFSLAACASTPEHTPTVLAVKAELGTDGVQRASLLAGSYFFDPARVTVKVNIPVELTIRKEAGLTPHNFTLKEPSAGLDLDISLSGTPQTIKFTPTKTGLFNFYCNKKLPFMESHRDKGMTGVLEVVE